MRDGPLPERTRPTGGRRGWVGVSGGTSKDKGHVTRWGSGGWRGRRGRGGRLGDSRLRGAPRLSSIWYAQTRDCIREKMT